MKPNKNDTKMSITRKQVVKTNLVEALTSDQALTEDYAKSLLNEYADNRKNDTKMSDTTASDQLTASGKYSQELRRIYHKHITENKYTKYNSATHVVDNVPVEAIGDAMKAHTAQRLSELKEKVEGEISFLNDEEIKNRNVDRGALIAYKNILQLIEEKCS